MSEAKASARPPLIEIPDRDGLPGVAADQQARPILVVLGMHRSGTSLCAHVLSALGVDMTDDIGVEPANRRGQWERLDLRDLHDRILDLFDRGYHSPHHDLPLPTAWWADPRVRSIERSIVSLLRRRMPDGPLFGFKDPRTARLLPVWRQVFKQLTLEPRIVLCLRNPAQVARSLLARDGLPLETGEYRWFCYTIEALSNLPDGQICVIEYEDWFVDPAINLGKLAAFLGESWEDASTELRIALSRIIDPELRHDGPRQAEARQAPVRSLYKIARGFAADAAARERLDRLVQQFAAFRELHRPLYEEHERICRIAAELPVRDEELSARARAEQLAAEREAEIAAIRAELAAREAAFTEVTRRNVELGAALAEAREERDQAVQAAEELEEIADAAQSAIDVLRDTLASAEAEHDRLADECTRLAAEGTAWFDAAIVGEVQRVTRSRRRRGWRVGRYVLQFAPARGRGSPMYRADRARAAGEWHRAVCFYLDALAQLPGKQPAIWVQFGHALREAGRTAEAEFAYRRAIALDRRHADALVPLGQILRQEGRDAEAASTYRRALELTLPAEKRAFVSGELTALGYPAEA